MHPADSTSVARDPRIEEAASIWLARHDAGLTADEQQEFKAWLEAAPAHATVWAELNAVWATFDEPLHLGQADLLIDELAARQHRRRWRLIGGGLAAGLAAAAAVVVLFTRPAPLPPEPSEIVLSAQHNVLNDGSHVELNTGAEIAVRFTPARRDIRLIRGEAHFAVAKNPARPFVVKTNGVEVRAVGTAFAVRLDVAEVNLLVSEGVVAVQCDGDPNPVLVTAGNQMLIPHNHGTGGTLRPFAQTAQQIDERFAWRNLQLDLTGITLSETVARFNQRNLMQLAIADPNLGEMRLSGIFRVDNAEGFVRLLESNYGVKIERRSETEIILGRK